MLVADDPLRIAPLADEVFRSVLGRYAGDVEFGPVTWSNELAAHVIELKTSAPAEHLGGLADLFQSSVRCVNALAAPLGARLMPTAMHPWMDPLRDTRLWPHEYSRVYDAFNRIFDCRGHGWSNVQSAHLNLPFDGDEEFGRLHAAIRVLLPMLPALAASSPVVQGRRATEEDARLAAYAANCRRVPQVTGSVIPEPAFTQAGYARDILQPMYAAIAPLDPDDVLQEEWLNARGAIARFSRGSIEIRLLDVQEHPSADLAIITLVVTALRDLVQERHAPFAEQCAWQVQPLAALCQDVVVRGADATVQDPAYGQLFGVTAAAGARVGELWQALRARHAHALRDAREAAALDLILTRGSLSRRIAAALGNPAPGAEIAEEQVRAVYGRLADCLAAGEAFA